MAVAQEVMASQSRKSPTGDLTFLTIDFLIQTCLTKYVANLLSNLCGRTLLGSVGYHNLTVHFFNLHNQAASFTTETRGNGKGTPPIQLVWHAFFPLSNMILAITRCLFG
jgi:hypothetical protein